ncbi:hypothetical protein MPTA5024_40260 [Microbispora sp. ATCC PTA-5024]|nr:hypothetical protein MPTA5024_40260 [Microbispora sp. ATCC PTA-5024]
MVARSDLDLAERAAAPGGRSAKGCSFYSIRLDYSKNDY